MITVTRLNADWWCVSQHIQQKLLCFSPELRELYRQKLKGIEDYYSGSAVIAITGQMLIHGVSAQAIVSLGHRATGTIWNESAKLMRKQGKYDCGKSYNNNRSIRLQVSVLLLQKDCRFIINIGRKGDKSREGAKCKSPKLTWCVCLFCRGSSSSSKRWL